jgi:hypothetical protein
MKRAVAATLIVFVLLQAPLQAELVKINKVVETVKIGPNPISINIPPTTWVSIALTVAQVLIGEANNKQINERLVRIDAKLDAILTQLGVMSGELRSISAKLDYISDQLTNLQQTAELIPARTAAHTVNGHLKGIRARMPAYIADRRKSATKDQIRADLSTLENETETLIGFHYPAFYLTAGTSILVQRDLAELLSTPANKALIAKEFDTELNEILGFLDHAVSSTAIDNGTLTIDLGDSFPVRTAKLTRALASELPVEQARKVPAFPACLYNAFTNTVTLANGLVWQIDFASDEYVVDVTEVDTGFCTKAIMGLQKTDFMSPLASYTDANWLVHGKFKIAGALSYDSQTSQFVSKGLFYYPHEVTACELDCNATRCRGAVTFGGGPRRDCYYGVLSDNKRTKAPLLEFAKAWMPLFPEHAQAEALLKKRVERANQLIIQLADARASMDAIQALRNSIVALQTSR